MFRHERLVERVRFQYFREGAEVEVARVAQHVARDAHAAGSLILECRSVQVCHAVVDDEQTRFALAAACELSDVVLQRIFAARRLGGESSCEGRAPH